MSCALPPPAYSSPSSSCPTCTIFKVAVKVIDRSKAPPTYLDKFLPREIAALRRLCHPNIVRMHNPPGFDSLPFYKQPDPHPSFSLSPALSFSPSPSPSPSLSL